MPARLFLLLLLAIVSAPPAWSDEPAVDSTKPLADEIAQQEIHAAIERALPLLEKGAVGHREQRSCFSCHQQGVPLLTLSLARQRGFEVNGEEFTRQLEFIAKFVETNRQAFLDGKGTGGQVDTAGYLLLALKRGEWAADENTSAVIEYLLAFQKEADHWTNSSKRPPSEASVFTTNYVGLLGLASFATEEQRERASARREQVRSWLRGATPVDTEDRVFRLLTLKLLEAPSETIREAVEELRSAQHENGGWPQNEELTPDAYATGSVLYALHEAGGVSVDDPAYQRGLRFLLDTQLEDGTWHVVSRSKPFQKYFETGFPHEKDQFISAAASAWATAALLAAITEVNQ
jgi:hypothetical protein